MASVSNIIHPAKFFFPLLRIRTKDHAYTSYGGMAVWGEYQVKDGRKIVGRAPTLAEALKRFPRAAIFSNWPEDDELADKHNEALSAAFEKEAA